MKIEKRKFECFRNNLKIKGTVFLPESGKNLPVAVICHEFMANQKLSFDYAEALAQEGMAAFCFDFCGGGLVCSSDGSRREMSVMTEVEDLRQVITFAKAQDYTDGKRLVLMGCSQGGLVAALMASEIKDDVDALILLYPALSIPDDARNGSMLGLKFDPQNIPDKMMCGPMPLGKCYVEDVINLNVFAVIPEYKGKVLLIHGDKDTVVSPEYSKKAADAYSSGGADVNLVMIEGGKHVFQNKEHKEQAIQKIVELIRSLQVKS